MSSQLSSFLCKMMAKSAGKINWSDELPSDPIKLTSSPKSGIAMATLQSWRQPPLAAIIRRCLCYTVSGKCPDAAFHTCTRTRQPELPSLRGRHTAISVGSGA